VNSTDTVQLVSTQEKLQSVGPAVEEVSRFSAGRQDQILPASRGTCPR
jgi:hypothetical protein